MSDDGSGRESLGETPVATDGGASLVSRVFQALRNRRRRYVLYYLRDHEQAQLDDLAIQLAAWEQDIPPDEVSSEDIETVATDLVHTHLPKLEEYGLVDYDRRTETAASAYTPSLLDEALELAATIENP